MQNKFSLEFSFSQTDVENYAKLSGDNNPIHLDEKYASNTVFKKRIMHGFLGASIFSRIFGTLYPGEGTIYLKQDLNFMAPMFAEETYTAIVEVDKINHLKARAIVKTYILDKSQKVVIKGEALIQNNMYKVQ